MDEGTEKSETSIKGENDNLGEASVVAADTDSANVNTKDNTKDSAKDNENDENSNTINSNNNSDQVEEEAESEISSSTSECSSSSNEDENEADLDDESEMPLLKYARIVGSLPRSSLGGVTGSISSPSNSNVNANSNSSNDESSDDSGKPLSKACKCSVIGKVTITPSKSNESGMPSVSALGLSLPMSSDSSHGASALASEAQSTPDETLTSRTQTFIIHAMATEDGSIHLIDPRTGFHLCPPNQMKVCTGSQKPNIVALSFDASGTYLAALSSEGDVAIFEFRFGITTEASSNNWPQGDDASVATTESKSKPVEKRPEMKAFDSFLSRLAGGDEWSSTAQSTNNVTETSDKNVRVSSSSGVGTDGSSDGNDNDNHLPPIPTLKLTHPISTARFSYKSSNSKTTKATCIELDPSYKRKREKCLIVGFSNGRIIYTKRSGHGGVVTASNNFGGVMGNLLQPKRHDIDLFQGTGNTRGSEYRGIEYITWRGLLVSWADSSGLKLFDIERMIRIAHIDRPTGARASLYPGISTLAPTLIFERSDSLLIAWGDCLMNMTIKNVVNGINNDSGTSQSKRVTKRTVKCAMAWQLDCVACGVVPLDSEHVAVLGLIPNTESEGGETREQLVELQVICRSNGIVVQSDVLPLLETEVGTEVENSTSEFILTSSFATPRMEDSFEAEEEEYMNEEAVDFDIQSMLNMDMASTFINSPSSTKEFINPHMKWDITSYKNVISSNLESECSEGDEESSLESNSSEYSDDYTFLFSPKKSSTANHSLLWQAPSMVITSPHDAVLVQTRGVDDSIEHARSSGKHGLALKRGLDHRQIIRGHNLNDLIDEYFAAVLFQSCPERSALLTIDRLKIAARATENLFGGNVEMWDKWTTEFAKIPGALFLLRSHLPTRDPKLPHTLYETVLLSMFAEIESMFTTNKSEDHTISQQIQNNATDLFLEAFRAWGPISSLRNRLKLHRITINDDTAESMSQSRLFNEAETAFASRMNQSAERYLQCNTTIAHYGTDDLVNAANLPSGITFDSLYQSDVLLSAFQAKLEHAVEELQDNRVHSVVLEVLAEATFMKGQYKESLYHYLSLASYIDNPISSIEEEAIASLTNSSVDITGNANNDRYKHVLTMIETYDLHRSLLKKRSGGRNDSSKALPPLVSLICLVGLEASGTFILQHCTLPRSSKPSTPGATNENRSDFPINQVAAQFNPYPKLLYWFLQRIFTEKPDIYVQFPNTAVPPSAVTDLHRIHFNLHVDYADRSYEMKKLTSIPTFDELNKESPMMTFLKAALPHGGIRSDDVRKALERCRTESDKADSKVKHPHLFAHELAYVIERSGAGSEDDATEVLNLYLEGVVSLPLAVEYVERHTSFSSMLWEALVSYCLNAEIDDPTDTNNNEKGKNGQLFGSLLEVAARSGADLAHLVSKIPTGMSIHGIRSKLVTAISDYRFKVKINEDAAKILSKDKVSLLREQCHRSRRGVRIDLSRDVRKPSIGSNA